MIIAENTSDLRDRAPCYHRGAARGPNQFKTNKRREGVL